MNTPDYTANLQRVQTWIQDTCAEAGRSPDEVELIAVSKTKPVDAIREVYAAGQRAFGENRMQELQQKMDELADLEIEWHFLGNIQTNKLKTICHRVDVIESVDKVKYLHEIEKRAGTADRTIGVYLQVNISDEPQKGGFEPDTFLEMASKLPTFEHVRIEGVMAMASLTHEQDVLRGQFRLLYSLFESLKEIHHPNFDIHTCSMGMSGDLDVAIAEGSTQCRIGSSIFGPRNTLTFD
ncbi:MAG: YggS family pyridoxal phosphate-dependent enzyme [Balneolaceae bacterium]|nr:YggS family pyridoxal phosphate-dependent enzyme [Balneolaceae bacterium]MDR9446473.1 YggS family pyridoxal phosphate-dependent enzyme [Balneolaceae bacterium]